MRRLRNLVTRKRGGGKRRWLFLAGAGAAGVAGWGIVRRRGASEHAGYLTSDDPGEGTGTAAGDPTAGLEMTDPNAVRTGIDVPGGGDGSTPATPAVFGTSPDGGYVDGG